MTASKTAPAAKPVAKKALAAKSAVKKSGATASAAKKAPAKKAPGAARAVKPAPAVVSGGTAASRPAVHRCAWAGEDARMRAYHDDEWGVPEHDSRALWEKLMLDGFQAGLSWRTILHKRDALRKAFAGFDPAKVARFTGKDVERLMQDAGIVRSRAKIEATIRGAQVYLEMAKNGEDFAEFCWSFTGGKPVRTDGGPRVASSPVSEHISKELKRRGFKFVGPVIVYAWMQAVGIIDDHDLACFRRKSA
ncbi:DNA-3-methyladenine glycosylase I [Achromobacter aloeverae]